MIRLRNILRRENNITSNLLLSKILAVAAWRCDTYKLLGGGIRMEVLPPKKIYMSPQLVNSLSFNRAFNDFIVTEIFLKSGYSFNAICFSSVISINRSLHLSIAHKDERRSGAISGKSFDLYVRD